MVGCLASSEQSGILPSSAGVKVFLETSSRSGSGMFVRGCSVCNGCHGVAGRRVSRLLTSLTGGGCVSSDGSLARGKLRVVTRGQPGTVGGPCRVRGRTVTGNRRCRCVKRCTYCCELSMFEGGSLGRMLSHLRNFGTGISPCPVRPRRVET